MFAVKRPRLSPMSISDFRQVISAWNVARFAPIPLRLIVGYGFFAHGVAKLEKGPQQFVSIVRGGLAFSDTGISGFLSGHCRREVHAKAET